MLYQLSYLGAGPLPISPCHPRPIKFGSAPAGLPPLRRAQPGSDTDRSASGPDRHRRSAGCRTAAAASAAGLPQIGQVGSRSSALSHRSLSIVHAVAGRLGSERRIKARPARRARSANASASPCSAATIAGDARSAGIRCGGCRNLGRDATQRRQPRGVRSGEQFVQRRMHARPDDLGQAEGGEAEQPRTQRIVGQRGVQGRRQRGAPARRQAGEIHQDRAGQVAQPDLPRQHRQHRPVRRQVRRPPCPAAAATAPPASTSIATSAGVG